MAGGVIQLIIYGSQDMYLTANPQITYFKVVYRRHTNFSIEPFEINIQNPKFGNNNLTQIFRLGDLMTKMYLRIVINNVIPNEGSKFAWIRRLGHAIIKNISIEIGGYTVDKQCGTWIDIWYELSRQGYHERGYNNMIGDIPIMTEYNNSPKPEYILIIPLQFWFNRFYGLAIPLISIQYHQIYMKFEIEEKNKLIITNNKFTNFDQIQILSASYIIDYIYLDILERDFFANMAHEYLIEQVQFDNTDNRVNNQQKYFIQFNHPIKELFWVMKNGNYINSKKFLCYTNKDNWEEEILKCSKQLLLDSIILLCECDPSPDNGGTWEEFKPLTEGTTINGKINVKNESDRTLWVNTNSLIIDNYSITNKICGNILVNNDRKIILTNIKTDITVRDISIPIEWMTDTRIQSDDVCVNQFNNYGILIDGSVNPIRYSKFQIDEDDRFIRRDYKFYNYLQPEIHHSNIPKDGINIYSFALYPEKHQPSGTYNISRVKNNVLYLWFEDITKEDNLPDLQIINNQDQLYIFGLSYNIFRVMNGLTAIAYMN